MSKETKVGLFVAAGIVTAAVTVFMIGDNKQTWASKVAYTAPFKDVAGLKPGAPVKLGGVDIGLVTTVGYSTKTADPLIYVTLEVKKAEAVRIRRGTKASVAMMGMLGDKMLVLKVDNPAAEAVPAGGVIETDEGSDVIAKAQAAVDKASDRLDEIGALTRPLLSDPNFVKDIAGIAANLREITAGVAHNDSAAHRLLMDPKEGERVDVALANIDAATLKLATLLGALDDVAYHVRTGPGVAHAVIYDGELSKDAAGALAEVRKDLEAIRNGNGLAHAALYGDDEKQKLLGNMNAMSEDLRGIVAEIRAGKGTLGGLLVDPTIYEDLKSAVGNVERNQVLRALVRYSIKQDEGRAKDPVARDAHR